MNDCGGARCVVFMTSSVKCSRCSAGSPSDTLSIRAKELASWASALTNLDSSELRVTSRACLVSRSDNLEVTLTFCADSSLWGALKAVSSAGHACVVQVEKPLRALDTSDTFFCDWVDKRICRTLAP